MKLKPGYTRTEVGVIPEEWSITRIGDKAAKVGSGITPRGGEKVYGREGRPFLRSQNIGWGQLLLDDVAYIDEDIHETFKSTELELDDVLLNITGASIGRSAVVDDRVVGGNVNQHVCIIRTSTNSPIPLDPRYLNFFLLSNSGQKQIDSFQAGGNRQGLNFGQIRSFVLPLPPHAEQREIACAIADMDALLGALGQLVAKKRDLKQAAIQQLLSGQTRLPGFSGKWQTTALGALGSLSKGKGIRKDDVLEEGLPCIRYGEIYTQHNDVIRSFQSFISHETARGSRRLRTGDLVFAGSGETAEEIGKCVAFLGREEVYVGGDTLVLTPAKQDSQFLGYLMNHPSVARQKARMGQGDAVVHISARNLASVVVSIPTPKEQHAIGCVLSDIDAELAALEQHRDKTRSLKKGMMQELLTGTTRLV